MGTVTDYLADVTDDDSRAALQRVVDIALALVPGATEGMSYGMPALRHLDKPLIAVVEAKQHLSLFPFSGSIVDEVAPDLDGFSLSKGTIRFDVGRPLPEAVIEQIVRLRVAEIEAKA
jgi:uncharacterized protein YdhG (YjbR/CyaY superfamily)